MNDMEGKSISLSEYKYELPTENIAKFPLSDRSQSKLLIYDGNIKHKKFKDIIHAIPQGATLIFNDTKVIPARLHFRKETGALIEIFLLEPLLPTNNVAEAMLVKNNCTWQCMIGNLKKWKDNTDLSIPLNIEEERIELCAVIKDRSKMHVEFSWNSDHSFVDIVEAVGKIPLPPYIDREVEEQDHERYQTVYSAHEGAVAAPTAGLHFTDTIIENLTNAGITLDYLTLHVSAGTFQPIKEENAMDHPMHSEQIVISINNIETLMKSKKIIAVGTTSMRSLESLYWFGVKILLDNDSNFQIGKLYPYHYDKNALPDMKSSFQAVKDFMLSQGVSQINGHTEIFIFPGYNFKVCDGLITNYHLPGSTLILLVAAFIGEDWRRVYEEALANNYRFLSYGDSSLLLP